MTAETPSRLDRLLTQDRVTCTGIDFVRIDPANRTALEVRFFHPLGKVEGLAERLVGHPEKFLLRALAPDQPPPGVTAAEAAGDGIRLRLDRDGGVSRCQLRIADEGIDPWFATKDFSFAAGCSGQVDCRAPELRPPGGEDVDFDVDYEARDFGSFRRALLDFAAQRHPGWTDRLEADVGVMLAELLSALGDEMSYHQDRIAREAYLETAVERRSVRRHARLVDYEMHDGLGATTWLALEAKVDGKVPRGALAWAVRDGSRVYFEVGEGLHAAPEKEREYEVKVSRNGAAAHVWDPADPTLRAGATRIAVKGSLKAELGPKPKLRAVLESPPNPADGTQRTHLVTITAALDAKDPLEKKDPLGNDVAITFLEWEEQDALPFDLDLRTVKVRFNVVPATAGRTWGGALPRGPSAAPIEADRKQYVSIGPVAPDAPPGTVPAIERDGPFRRGDGGRYERAVTYLYALPGSNQEGLVWRGDPAHVRSARPELLLIPQRAVTANGSEVTWEDAPERWEWRRSAIGEPPASPVFTLDDGFWRGLARPGDPTPRLVDYAGDPGWTIRFSWGEFGRRPQVGTNFRVIYRLGNGSRGNLPAGAIHGFDAEDPAWASVAAISNPLPSEGGVDPEPLDEVRRNAPEEYRASPLRAVRPEDYARAAERRFGWVDRAGARLRWTGSWPVLFATADSADGRPLGAERRAKLAAHLEEVRQTGRSIQVREPEYADLDLVLFLCVEPTAYPEEVKARVLEALLGGEHPVLGPGAFTFGTPLRRSVLEAAIMRTTGVRAVSKVTARRRGFEAEHELGLEDFRVGENVIIRVANDPAHPERGSVRIDTRGGA